MSEKIKDRIEKLYRKAESAEEIGSIQEAETFMAKAQELLVRYNLELSDLNLEHEKAEAIGVRVNVKERHGWSKTDGDWLIRLYSTVSIFNFCRIVSHGTEAVTIIGEQHNIDMVEYICSNVVPTIKRLRLKAWKEYVGIEKANAFKRGYYRGVTTGLFSKLSEQQNADKQKYDGLSGLIVVNNALVKDKMAELFPRLGTRRTRGLSAGSGQLQGYNDGKNMQINKGVSGSSRSAGNLLN